MQTATARAPQPGKQKGRPVAGGGLSINFVSNDTITNSADAVRAQRLAVICGVVGRRAALIASLVWGEVQDA